VFVIDRVTTAFTSFVKKLACIFTGRVGTTNARVRENTITVHLHIDSLTYLCLLLAGIYLVTRRCKERAAFFSG